MANLAAFKLDIRFEALAQTLGFEYSRYADDLAFSSEQKTHSHKLIRYVKTIVKDEGFILNPEKTRLRLANHRQSLCGLVVNEKINLPTKVVKALEAELFNCVRYGSKSQNRAGIKSYRCHLQGRISQLAQITPIKAEKLWSMFDQIDWNK